MNSNDYPSFYHRQPHRPPYNSQPLRPFVQEDTLKSEMIHIERKSFLLTLKENLRGPVFLRITEEVGGNETPSSFPQLVWMNSRSCWMKWSGQKMELPSKTNQQSRRKNRKRRGNEMDFILQRLIKTTNAKTNELEEEWSEPVFVQMILETDGKKFFKVVTQNPYLDSSASMAGEMATKSISNHVTCEALGFQKKEVSIRRVDSMNQCSRTYVLEVI
jgi:hypothetical protein